MRIKYFIVLCGIFIILSGLTLSIMGQDGDNTQGTPTIEDIRKLLSEVPDDDLCGPPCTPQEHKCPWMKMRSRIISAGPAVFSAFMTILKETNDSFQISHLLSIVREIKRDKSQIIPSIIELLERDNASIRSDAIRVLGDIGNFKECADILNVCNDKDESVRGEAYWALGKLGDDKTAQEIEKILDKRNGGLKNEDIKKDYSVGPGYLAIMTIKYRIIKAKTDKEQDVKIRELLIKEWLRIEKKYEHVLLEKTSTHWLTGEFAAPSNEVTKRITARLLRKVLPDEIKSETDQKNKEILEEMLKEAREYNDDIVSLLKETKKEQDKREQDEQKPKDSPDKSGKDDTDHSGDKPSGQDPSDNSGQDKPQDKK